MATKDLVARKNYAVAYRAAHRDWLKARRPVYDATYYAAHPGAHSAAMHSYYVAHRDERLAYSATYRLAHRDEKRISAAAYRATHRAEGAAHVNARRARKIGNGGSHTLAEWREKIELFAHLCAYCGEAKPLERDHKIPLILGGSDDISNIIPSCRSCNSRKGIRSAAEFIAALAVAA